MLTPPDGLSRATLLGSLANGWGVTAASADYRPVGFGSQLTHQGEPLARTNERFAVALYPFITGQSFTWGEFPTTEHREAVLDLVIALHTAPRPAAALMARQTQPLRTLIDQYDELVAHSRTEPDRLVLTHGEPHPGNTMLAATGWVLIDWDTALLAPPERDLWSLDPGDGSILDAYAAATGVAPLPQMLKLYRIRWDLADLAVDVGRFRRHHTGNADDDASWLILRRLVENLSARTDDAIGTGTTILDQE